MSNLVVTKNGNLVKRDSRNLGNFSGWTSFIDGLFADELRGFETRDFNQGITSPRVNIKESVDDFTLEMAVPGFKKSDFVIDIDNEELSVSAEIKTEDQNADSKYTRREFGYGSFKRTFLLPESASDEGIKAVYAEGILSISIPKKEEAKPKPAKTIKIS
jgi:HSP20 family protein